MTKNIRINSNKVINILISTLFIFIILLLRSIWIASPNDITISEVKITAWIAILTFIFAIYGQYRMSGEILNILSIFTLAVFVFSNGELALIAFNVPYSELNAFYLGRFSDYEITMAGLYNNLSLLALNIGIVLTYRNIKMNTSLWIQSNPALSKSMVKAMKSTGFFLIAISIPFDFYDKLVMAISSATYGYEYLYSETYIGVSSIISTLSLFCIPGCFLLSLGYKNNKIAKWIPLCYLVLRSLLILYSGKRGQAIGLLAAMVWFLNKNYKKASKKYNIFKLGLIAYFALVIMSTIVTYRSTINKSVLELLSVFSSQLINVSVVKDVLNEMGFSIRPLLELMKYSNNGIITPKYGVTYLFSLIMIIPSFLRGSLYSVGSSRGWIGIEDWLTASLGTSYGLGFSIQAEGYYNYGQNGWLIMIIFGWLMCRLMTSTSKNEDMQLAKTAFSATLLALLIISARSSTQLLFKYMIYYYALPFMILHCFRATYRKDYGK